MYYKLEEGNETFDKLDNVWLEIVKCNKEAFNLVEKLGFKRYGKGMGSAGGGISCIQSDNKPNGFKKLRDGLYYPRKDNKVLNKSFEALPLVSNEKYNKTIGFKSQVNGNRYHNAFGSKKVNDIYLISVSEECKYTPTKDMVEITITEYKSLSEKSKV